MQPWATAMQETLTAPPALAGYQDLLINSSFPAAPHGRDAPSMQPPFCCLLPRTSSVVIRHDLPRLLSMFGTSVRRVSQRIICTR